MSALQEILNTYRQVSVTEREKGTYFEELIVCYLRNEASYRDLYSDVWTYATWAKQQDLPMKDTGIDLVAKTQGTNEYHAIQCKFFSENYTIQKTDIDSFFTASGKIIFTHRIIVSTTDKWSENAENALYGQQPPVSKIDLHDLENSAIDWAKYHPKADVVLKKKKDPLDHQTDALKAVTEGLQSADRGKLLMACGSGKTYTSLKIAESLAGRGKRVLFLVPSLALLSQTLTEWTQESAIPVHSFAVCSDSDVGKKRTKEDDAVQTFAHELRYPATTDAKKLATEMAKRHDATHMSVVFSTYHSINVLCCAQKEHGLDPFDLIVCDEAHRTTGVKFGDEDESSFIKVHDNNNIMAHKRLYMTATPRIYGDAAKETAKTKGSIELCSMDDVSKFGEELYVLTFSDAVKRGLLVDYKVIVLAVEESHVSRRLQDLLKDENNQLKMDDAAKIIGCWKALSKHGLQEGLADDNDPMRRAVAFCQVIEKTSKARKHKVSSKNIASMFQQVVETYQKTAPVEEKEAMRSAVNLACETGHVDGGMNAGQKEAKLDWLKAETPLGTCRILSNVRCLSEGVDVPALDAVLFLTPRNSQVEVVQSVGRVMRTAHGKKRGYVILPVVIPAGMEPHQALNKNEPYRVVWQVLQALRSHDDRFDAMINKTELNGPDLSKMEVVAVTGKVEKKAKTCDAKGDVWGGGASIGGGETSYGKSSQGHLVEIGEIERAIYAKLVQKCGNRHYWEKWTTDIAGIARTHIDRINGILENEASTAEREAFQSFVAELRDDLNSSITDAEVVEMLAQHIITKPVFEALFEGYSFAGHNPISLGMQSVLDILQEHHLDKEADTLKEFYDSVRLRAEGINNAKGKQKIIVELYENFFGNAFPGMKERLGIVYTPVEVVDFIINSVCEVLNKEFGKAIGSDGVHIIDPFTGTGTFITRLIQSKLISKEQLVRKYANEIHANEIVLLAYYIAAINIESAYHDIVGGEYQPFQGICLADTFTLTESLKTNRNALPHVRLEDNSARLMRQEKLDIRVIIGNPPYSEGQTNANDNNQNVAYPTLDERIRGTYAKRSTAMLSKGLYNSYVRAIRWASDRIGHGHGGVVAFVSGAGFTEKPAMNGIRKCLAQEFSSIYVFHLRGDQRTSGEMSRREGGKIFGRGSRSPIAISILVKNPLAKHHGQIYFHDIGDYLTREEKFEKITSFSSISGIAAIDGWQHITPDEHGDWLQQRDDGFSGHIEIGSKKDSREIKLFNMFSLGVSTSRDAWCYNASKTNAANNMHCMINFYNKEVDRFDKAHVGRDRDALETNVDKFISNDCTQISWSRALKQYLVKKRKFNFEEDCIVQSLYRPFTKQWMYFNRIFNEMVLLMHRIFPDDSAKNMVICMSGIGARGGFSTLITDKLPNLHTLDTGQCFPLYIYDEPSKPKVSAPKQAQGRLVAPKSMTQGTLATTPTNTATGTRTRRDAITDAGLAHFQVAYPGETLSKQDVFYYVYGMLHSPDYRTRYADNLSKELPRIPRVKTAFDFWAFSKAGRELAEFHINYEKVEPYPLTVNGEVWGKAWGGDSDLTDADYRVEKMKYGKNGKGKDRSTLVYNHKITLTAIPLEAYEYVVNGKAALDTVVERQCVKTYKDSGIVNDANDWALETMQNPRYPLELFARVVTVSLETMKIVKRLPLLNI